ncbi:FAD-dependent oxidoreductase [Nocardia concava]|uniref:FAD-dependent oxidoreductase n=1 Tax=Nocardia concava TaxID=257281 RepID=UPI0005954C6B|nr:NAD(P)/FAD-dependent oxidoreductase [Nocardia concava]
MRVVIVGAGLGGLCLAQGLGRGGVECEVFERDSGVGSRTQGYRIRIDAQGQRSLAACLPGELVTLFRETAAVARSGGRFVDTGLNEITGRAVETWQPSVQSEAEDDQDGDLSVNRQTLREILMSGIEGRIRFGKELIHVEEGLDRVTARFRDGTTVAGDVLVAADGVHSAVRRQLCPAADPTDTGMVCVYGRTGLDSRAMIDDSVLDGTSVVFADGFATIVDAMTFRPDAFTGQPITPVADYLYWACFGPRALFGLDAGADPHGDLPTTLAQLTADWHPGLRAVLTTSDPNAVAALPIRSAAVLPDWPGRRITALGDAVHAMSPAGGLGANTALRDAATLAELLCGDLTSVDALADYERHMRVYAEEAVTASERGAARLTGAMT